MLIVFDGIDGVGKTTQLELVKAQLEKQGMPVETSRNLGGTPIGEALRDVMLSGAERPETTNLYISAAIQEALIDFLQDKKRAGHVILMDRGPLSLATYELYGSGVDAGLIWPHVEHGMQALSPDLTIIYDADVATAVARSRQRSDKADYFESKGQDYFERVADGYRQCAEKYGATIIDANREVSSIHADTMKAVRPLLQR